MVEELYVSPRPLDIEGEMVIHLRFSGALWIGSLVGLPGVCVLTPDVKFRLSLVGDHPARNDHVV